jgi:Squalene-hopene cyclase C-terminal domain/Prenyltransferase and squalene oxidase repeat
VRVTDLDVLAPALVTLSARSAVERDFRELLGPMAPPGGPGGPGRDGREPDLPFDLAVLDDLVADVNNYRCSLYWPLFPDLDESSVAAMNLACRLVADHVLALDKLVDHDLPSEQEPVLQLASSYLQQRGLAQFHALFPASSPFWPAYGEHFGTMCRAIVREQAWFAQRGAGGFGRQMFEEIATGKCAMAKLAVDGLALLSNVDRDVAGLHLLLEDLAVAAQLVDDYQDWQQDLGAGHLSFLLTRVFAELGLPPEEQLRLARPQELRRLVMASSAVQDLLGEARERFHRIIRDPGLAGCDLWRGQLQRAADATGEALRSIRSALLRVEALAAQPAPRPPLATARIFLTTSQAESGCWSDFKASRVVPACTDWVTARVAAALDRDPAADPECVDRAAAWLLRQRDPEGGWGGAGLLAPASNAGATALCLEFLAGRLAPDQQEPALRFLLAHQDPGGGFRTYRDPTAVAASLREPGDAGGWCEPHACVTADAVVALLRAAGPDGLEPGLQERCRSALLYLLDEQQLDGHWRSYWWQGTVYATARCLDALRLAGQSDMSGLATGRLRATRDRGLEHLLRCQRPSGAWAAGEGAPDCPFQTALALGAMAGEPDTAGPGAIARAASFLVQTQRLNGSWKATAPTRRVPRPGDRTPWRSRDAAAGRPGISLADPAGHFTTATVLDALLAVQRSGVGPVAQGSAR